ncbi:hypothetical protein [Saccharothrix sp. NRRL B-16348]|uniref:hypothetical protein n=1 Tax=Saccharothrix sp. NRRL B-16348 TaxID=1415542 RepID=UPI0012F7A499|nr:hypothetical protein [Saccharothrix sp. NRRL B-16348]
MGVTAAWCAAISTLTGQKRSGVSVGTFPFGKAIETRPRPVAVRRVRPIAGAPATATRLDRHAADHPDRLGELRDRPAARATGPPRPTDGGTVARPRALSCSG